MNTSVKSDGRAQGRHAVVLGGSLAGLLTARVLADHFEEVTLIERDAYPDTTEARNPNRNHSRSGSVGGRKPAKKDRLVRRLLTSRRDVECG